MFLKKAKEKDRDAPNSRPDLILEEDTHADETHPSDHDSVAVLNPVDFHSAKARSRQKELDKRSKELTKLLEKGKADRWEELQEKRTIGHKPSFLCPVQYELE